MGVKGRFQRKPIGAKAALLWGLITVVGQVAAQPAATPAPPGAADPAAARSSTTGGPAWSTLTPLQQRVLAPLARDWPNIDSSRKAKWLEVAARFPQLPAADQQRVQERMGEWARMTPAERGRARLSYQESKQFSPEEKQARWEAYQALPDEKRRALAERQQPVAAQAPQPAAAGTAPQRPVAAASAPMAKPVAPTVMQAGPGATTQLMTRPADPPAHHRPGQPRIAARADQVDRTTLLPQSGPQAAASGPRMP